MFSFNIQSYFFVFFMFSMYFNDSDHLRFPKDRQKMKFVNFKDHSIKRLKQKYNTSLSQGFDSSKEDKVESQQTMIVQSKSTVKIRNWKYSRPLHLKGKSDSGFNYTAEEMLKFKIWPQAIVPYFIDDYSFDKVTKDRIRNYLDDVSSLTSLQFLELDGPPGDDVTRWVLFINRIAQLDCIDYTTGDFTNEGAQKVVVGYDCLSGGGGLAATMLALAGVPPQHNAPDRDSYIEVHTENILPEKKHLFQILKDDLWLFHEINYDFVSAGHYDFYKFTKNGFATIQPKKDHIEFNGNDIGFSRSDILKIEMLYNLMKKKGNPLKTPHCSKLLKPGAKFNNYVSTTGVMITPKYEIYDKNVSNEKKNITNQPHVTGNSDKIDHQVEDDKSKINNQKIKLLKQIEKLSRIDEDEIEKFKDKLTNQGKQVDITKLEDYHTAEE